MMKSPVNILIALAGLIILVFSIYMGHIYWFTDDVKDGSGIPSLTFMFTGVPIGLYLIFKKTVNKGEVGYLIPIGGMIAIFIVSYFYHDYLKKSKLEKEGVETYGVVTANGFVDRSPAVSGKEIKYSYIVNGISYNKYASNEQYILDKKIRVNDTIIITYWKSNPHYHDYKAK